MNDILYEKLILLSENKELVSIYYDGDTEQFYAGYILGVNDEEILFQHISPNGKYDGYVLKKLSSIYRIGYDESYLKKITKLYGFETRKHEEIDIDINNLMISFLKRAIENSWITVIELYDSGLDDIQGIIEKVDPKCIAVKKVTDEGEYDGMTYFDASAVTRIECDTENEQSIKRLMEERNM